MSNVQHKSVIEVNEEGSEAAAATAAQTNTRMAGPPHISMIFDRPFYFILQDKTHGINLFMGKIVDPSNGENVPENTSKDYVAEMITKSDSNKKSPKIDAKTIVILYNYNISIMILKVKQVCIYH